MNEPKIYCGDAKTFQTRDGQTCFEVRIRRSQWEKVYTEAKLRGWLDEFNSKSGPDEAVKLVFWPQREEKPYSTHYGVLSEPYRKDAGDGATGDEVVRSVSNTRDDDDGGLPF